MNRMSVNDAMFLLGETRDHPSHVIALELFEPPPDAGPEYLAELYRELLAQQPVKPLFRRTPERAHLSPMRWRWRQDAALDASFHIRRSALPHPGRVRELLELVSGMHGVPLHRDRPLWDFHLIEGLTDGRFATAFKTHHALADGVSLARHVLGGLDPDPEARDGVPPWVEPNDGGARSTTDAPPVPCQTRLSRAAKLGPATVRALSEMRRDVTASLPYDAPKSILNVPISGARRFAGDSWSHARLKAIATASGGTVNDVVLAMCSGALRRYLLELDALPDAPLIAMVPVSLRRPDDSSSEGNSFGTMLCNLGTDRADAADRLSQIIDATAGAKDRLSRLSPGEVQLLSRIVMGGSVLSAMTGVTGTPRQPFNLIVSNVPAGSRNLYWNGARLTEIYPLSMIMEGQAMNITVTRYVDRIAFGVVGCRTALPRLQRLLLHLDAALVELETAAS